MCLHAHTCTQHTHGSTATIYSQKMYLIIVVSSPFTMYEMSLFLTKVKLIYEQDSTPSCLIKDIIQSSVLILFDLWAGFDIINLSLSLKAFFLKKSRTIYLFFFFIFYISLLSIRVFIDFSSFQSPRVEMSCHQSLKLLSSWWLHTPFRITSTLRDLNTMLR